MVDLAGRTCLVTGANTGIGKATAQELARMGARVHLACRSEAKTRPVVEEIVSTTGNPAVTFLPLDLADLSSVRAAAQTFLDGDEALHILVNNAGVAGQRGVTADGFELAFGVNHLGHFLLAQLLLDRIVASAPARIVNVSSEGHYQAKVIDFDALRQPTRSFTGLPEYAVSKLCNVLFTQELARRLDPSAVSASSLHPGAIGSDIWRRVPWPIRPLMTLFMKSPEEGAETTIYCATAPELAGTSGRYYDNCRERDASTFATPELARQLWEHSEAWAGAPG